MQAMQAQNSKGTIHAGNIEGEYRFLVTMIHKRTEEELCFDVLAFGDGYTDVVSPIRDLGYGAGSWEICDWEEIPRFWQAA
jgi:hypothetical protein